jgi:hypothetical protein
MNTHRRVVASLVAVALYAGLVAAVLAIPRGAATDTVRKRAADLAERLPRQSTPDQALAALRTHLERKEALRILDDKRAVRAGTGPPVGDWTTVVAAVRPPRADVAFVELSASDTTSATALAGVAIACGAGLLALALVLAVARPPRRPLDVGAAMTGGPVLPVTDSNYGGNDDRRALVQELVRLVDISQEEPVVRRALQALERAGVEILDPRPGQQFDEHTQTIAAVVGTPDQHLHDSVSGLVRRGYRDRGRMVREAEVQVYGPADTVAGREERL